MVVSQLVHCPGEQGGAGLMAGQQQGLHLKAELVLQPRRPRLSLRLSKVITLASPFSDRSIWKPTNQAIYQLVTELVTSSIDRWIE